LQCANVLVENHVGVELDPGRQVFIRLIPALLCAEQRLVIRVTILENYVIQRIKAREMVAAALQQVRREQPRGAAIAVVERMDREKVENELSDRQKSRCVGRGQTVVHALAKLPQESSRLFGRERLDRIQAAFDRHTLRLDLTSVVWAGRLEHSPVHLAHEVETEKFARRVHQRPKQRANDGRHRQHALLQLFVDSPRRGLGRRGESEVELIGRNLFALDLATGIDTLSDIVESSLVQIVRPDEIIAGEPANLEFRSS
jgi:hypothetical protein